MDLKFKSNTELFVMFALINKTYPGHKVKVISIPRSITIELHTKIIMVSALDLYYLHIPLEKEHDLVRPNM